jgi:hypothetical protein
MLIDNFIVWLQDELVVDVTCKKQCKIRADAMAGFSWRAMGDRLETWSCKEDHSLIWFLSANSASTTEIYH